MKKRILLAVSALFTFVIMYQNCALQSGSRTQRDVRIESEAIVQVADSKGMSFLKWYFKPSNETSVEIVSSNNSFCKRGFILNSNAEKEWSYALANLKSKRDMASDGIAKNIRINYKGKTVNLTDGESQEFFELMEKTKKNHNVRITECEGKKRWSFKNIKIEQIVKTKSNSKIVQTFTLKVVNNEKFEMALDEQPIKIAKDKDEAFCNYTGMTYTPTSKLLTTMFNLDDFNKNQHLFSNRSLASSPSETLLLEIDGKKKFTIEQSSLLAQNFKSVIGQMKVAKLARKTCGYTY